MKDTDRAKKRLEFWSIMWLTLSLFGCIALIVLAIGRFDIGEAASGLILLAACITIAVQAFLTVSFFEAVAAMVGVVGNIFEELNIAKAATQSPSKAPQD